MIFDPEINGAKRNLEPFVLKKKNFRSGPKEMNNNIFYTYEKYQKNVKINIPIAGLISQCNPCGRRNSSQ